MDGCVPDCWRCVEASAMICAACGCEQVPGQFCRQCGVRFEAAAAQPFVPQPGQPVAGPVWPYVLPEQRMRVWQHLQPLGIMWCMYGVYRLVKGIVAATVVSAMAHGGFPFGDAPSFVPHIFEALAPSILVGSVVMAASSILTGYALLTRKPWARVLAIIVAVLSLIRIPVGTALGIYTLWVLAPAASGAEWERGQAGIAAR